VSNWKGQREEGRGKREEGRGKRGEKRGRGKSKEGRERKDGRWESLKNTHVNKTLNNRATNTGTSSVGPVEYNSEPSSE
jgi:hypothetical protein